MDNEIPVAGKPVPDWKEAKPLWGMLWNAHWIGIGAAFGLLTVTSVVALLKLTKQGRFRSKPYIIAVNSLLFILGATRAVYLLLDPYGSKQILPRWLAGLLFNISFPCLTSAFCLILYVFLGVAKLQLVSERLQNARFFISVISLHFIVVLGAVICVVFAPQMTSVVFIICHSFFILWGLLLSVSFIYGGIKVIRSARTVSRQLKMQRRASVSKVAKVTLLTSVLGLACSILHVYSLFIVYRFFLAHEEHPEPWTWWAFQTCFRLIEIAMACNISYCILQSSKRSLSASRMTTFFNTISPQNIISVTMLERKNKNNT